MKGILMMLKAFGLSDADVERIRIFLPQVPSVAQNAIQTVNKAVADFDVRLKLIEMRQQEILEALNGLRSRELQRTNDTAGSTPSGTANGSGDSAHGAIAGGSIGGRRRGNR